MKESERERMKEEWSESFRVRAREGKRDKKLF